MTYEELRLCRTDQVGSLLRPPDLVEAFLAHGRGELSIDDLQIRQDEAIRGLLAEQERHGLPIVSDGEYRRLNWQVSFWEVEGWEQWSGSWAATLANPSLRGEHEQANTKADNAVITYGVPATGKLRLVESFPLREWTFAASCTDRPVKAMIMGPDRVAQMCHIEESAPHYHSRQEFLDDVVAVHHRMVTGLVEAGCPYVQLDEPSYTGYVDPDSLDHMAARGQDPLANLNAAIDASNGAIEGLAGRAVFGLHICRGNRASMWHREGHYDAIAETVFGRLRFDRLLLEYDTERAGGFEPLRYVPKNTMVVLGLITTKTGEVETVDELLARIEEASRFIDVNQLAMSPQCGFASGISGNDLTHDEQWRKLDVLQEAAQQVWE
ncbi:MAG: cobalamin-independent methionine synthase II family protein [Acidimicrobiales bacterium]